MPVVALCAVLIASAAPALPLTYLFAAQVIVGSGRWAGLPPFGLGLTGLVTLALVLKVVFLASSRAPGPVDHRPAARRRRGVLPPPSVRSVALAVGAFVSMLAVSLAWSPSPAYGIEKLFRLTAFNLLPAWLLWYALRAGYVPVDRLLAALRLCLLVLAGTGLVGVLVESALQVSRLSVGRTDPIAFGALSAAGALLWYEHLLSLPAQRRLAAGWATVTCIAAVLGSNSKGPAIALIFTVVVSHLFLGARRRRQRGAGRRVARAVLPIAVMIVLFLLVPARFVSRIDPSVLATVGRQPGFSESFSLRHRFHGHALAMVQERPILGRGLGGFNTVEETAYGERLPSGGRTVQYPHSLPLEVAAETGMLGLTALAVLALVIWSALRAPVARLDGAVLVVLASVSALFSGDLSDNRVLWFGLAVHLHLMAMRPAVTGGRRPRVAARSAPP